MIACIYSVKDELQRKYHNPIFIPNSDMSDQEAIRLFKSQVNNTTIWKENPEDFSLWYIGCIDDESAIIKSDIKKITDGRAVLNG